VFVDRIDAGRFEDTNRVFVRPDHVDVRVEADGTPQFWAERIFRELRPAFDPKRPTALFIGRYQPFHAGHQQLIEEGMKRVGQVCIAVRDTQHTDEKNPLSFFDVSRRQVNVPGGNVGDDAGLAWFDRCLSRHRASMLLQRLANEPFDEGAVNRQCRYFHWHRSTHEPNSLEVAPAMMSLTPVSCSHSLASDPMPASTISAVISLRVQSCVRACRPSLV